MFLWATFTWLHQEECVLLKECCGTHRDSHRAVYFVIALLVNFPGLCRTCEIFGVSRLVVPSKRILEDKRFTALSVTSEKWIPIEEVSVVYPIKCMCPSRGDSVIVILKSERRGQEGVTHSGYSSEFHAALCDHHAAKTVIPFAVVILPCCGHQCYALPILHGC